MTVEGFRKAAVAIFKEYFEHGDTRDVSVSQLGATGEHGEIGVCVEMPLEPLW